MCRAAWHAWGKLEDREGHAAEARQLYRRVLALDSNNVAALCALGALERRRGQLDAAEAFLHAATAADPHHAPAAHELALLLVAQGRSAQAVQMRRTAQRLTSQRRTALKEAARQKLPRDGLGSS